MSICPLAVLLCVCVCVLYRVHASTLCTQRYYSNVTLFICMIRLQHDDDLRVRISFVRGIHIECESQCNDSSACSVHVIIKLCLLCVTPTTTTKINHKEYGIVNLVD